MIRRRSREWAIESRIAQDNNLSSRSTSCSIYCQFVLAIVLTFVIQSSWSFSMQEYRPPVKTSVKNLHSDRSAAARGGTTSTSTHHRSAGMRTEQQQKKQFQPNQSPTQRRRFGTSSSKPSHAASVALPDMNLSRNVQSFERRMRDLVLGRQRQDAQPSHEASSQPYQQQHSTTTTTSVLKDDEVKGPGAPANVKVVHCLQDYKEIVGEEREKLVVVRFFATYCKACKAVAPLFYKMARDKSQKAIFVDVPVTRENTLLHQGLGIPTLPYAHIYHPEMGLVEEMSFTRKHVADVIAKLDTYIQGFCSLPPLDL